MWSKRNWMVKTGLFSAILAVIILILSGCTGTNSVLNSTNPTGTGENTANPGGSGGYSDPWASGTTGGISSGTPSSGSGLPGNKTPVITIKASQASVGFNSEVTITADAIDPDGDLLFYKWTASGGTFINQNTNKATWKAPEKPGSAEISCVAEDRKGGNGTAKTLIDVVGGRKYSVDIFLSRTSLLTDPTMASSQNGEWLPVPNAKVTFRNLNKELITSSVGRAELNLDDKTQTASGSEVIILYQGIEIKYNAVFMQSGVSQVDAIYMHPYLDGISVAVGKGDSFAIKRGGVEVKAVEKINGVEKALSEVAVEIGTTQQLAKDGNVFFSLVENDQTDMKISKTGYSPLEGLRIPVAMDGVTIVNARMNRNGVVSLSDAVISWTKPYNGQKAVSVMGPFEIGFAQPMETESIFNDLEMTIQETNGKSAVVVRGRDILKKFDVEWPAPYILQLIPKMPMKQLLKYSVHVTRWNARARDGRILKNYANMFGNFTTDSDQPPRVISTTPRNGDSNVSLAGPFLIKFDQSMNTESLYENLSLEITDLKIGLKMVLDGWMFQNYFSVTWTERNSVLSMVPKKMLNPRNSYNVRLLKTNLKSVSGKEVENLAGLWGMFTTGSI